MGPVQLFDEAKRLEMQIIEWEVLDSSLLRAVVLLLFIFIFILIFI